MTDHATMTDGGRLLGAADIRRIAEEEGISPTKKFGQNFVIDPGTGPAHRPRGGRRRRRYRS